jgi:hypothetical protein
MVMAHHLFRGPHAVDEEAQAWRPPETTAPVVSGHAASIDRWVRGASRFLS